MRFATCQDHAGGDDIAGSLAVNPSCAQPKIQSHDKLNFAGLEPKTYRQPYLQRMRGPVAIHSIGSSQDHIFKALT
jgi:hypothetical protein